MVVIASDRMGEPEEELGKVLIKGFIYALSRQEPLPETVIFYNGGAKLTAEGSESVEDLKYMAEQGALRSLPAEPASSTWYRGQAPGWLCLQYV